MDDTCPPAEEAAGAPLGEVLEEGVLSPVLEADGGVVWRTTGGDDDTGNEADDQGEQLDGRPPELGFTVDPHVEPVDEDDQDVENRDEDPRVEVFSPVLDDDAERTQLGRQGDGVGEEVVPAGSKAQGLVAEPRAVAREGLIHWGKRSHLPEREKHHHEQRPREEIPKKERRRTTPLQRGSGPDNQPGPQRTGHSHHTHLSRLEVSAQHLLVRRIAMLVDED